MPHANGLSGGVNNALKNVKRDKMMTKMSMTNATGVFKLSGGKVIILNE